MNNTSEINYEILIKEQKTTKPIIEDIIDKFLEGDKLKNAMDFIAFLRDNNMNPRWHSANSWRVVGKKGKGVCRIDLGGTKNAWHKHFGVGDWQISDLGGLERKYLDEFISNDEIKEFVWANIRPCVRCCSCGPRSHDYIGKRFDESCGFIVKNPDVKGVQIVKKLVETNKRHIYENA